MNILVVYGQHYYYHPAKPCLLNWPFNDSIRGNFLEHANKLHRATITNILYSACAGIVNRSLDYGIIFLFSVATVSYMSLSFHASGELIIDKGPAVAREAPIVAFGDNVYITWTTNITGKDEVMFRASNDGGATFSNIIKLSNSSWGNAQDPGIRVEDSNVIVTWWEGNQTNYEPFHRTSEDSGNTFGALANGVSDGKIEGERAAMEAESKATSWLDSVLGDLPKNDFYSAWTTNETGNDEVMFSASNDGGATFSNIIKLSNSSDRDVQNVEMASDGNSVIVTWLEGNQTDEAPIMKISRDSGKTFSSELMLDSNGTLYFQK